MDKEFHAEHFCCWDCDKSLTGQAYILREEHPYCIACYEKLFSNTCEKCTKIIGTDSKDLSYKEKHWHEWCFVCCICSNSLVDKPFGSKEEKIYCGDCYANEFASRCDGCSQVFKPGTKKMEYKGKQWHENCFTCNNCKKALGTQSFIPKDDHNYCVTCYEELFATKCTKCKKVISAGGVTYKNDPYHRDCFNCSQCKKSLAGERFTSKEEKPYCANCFGDLFAKKCFQCSKPITGLGGTKYISFEDRHWHNEHFNCKKCSVTLVGKGFLTDGDDILCPDCGKASA